MELPFPLLWRSCLLLLFVLLSMQLPHVQSLRMGVRNIFHNGSRHLPEDCDEVCASRLRMKRLFGGNKTSSMGALRSFNHNNSRMLRRRTKVQVDRNTDFWENYLQVSIGGQQLDLAVVTTWDFIALQCDCHVDDCLNPGAPFYSTSASTALQFVEKGEQFCKNFEKAGYGWDTEEHCGFQINDRKPFWSEGYAMKGDVEVWDINANDYETLSNFNVACSKRGSFNKQSTKSGMLVSGVAGFYIGGNRLSFPEQHNRGKSYSICIPSPDAPDSGFLILNDNNIADVEYTLRRLYSPQHVKIFGFQVGDLTVTVDAGPGNLVTFDTGSPYSRLSESWYTLFRNAWMDKLRELEMGDPYGHPDVPELETCYVYPKGIQLPTAILLLGQRRPFGEFTLGANVIEFWPPDKDEERHMCWPVVKMSERRTIAGDIVIGAIHVEKTQMLFDFGNRRFGWSHNVC